MTKEDTTSYRSVAKTTAVFGGAQIVQMFITILRAKIVAVLVGVAGTGVNALFQSSISTIQQLSSMGIFQSGVRELSQAKDAPDTRRFPFLVNVFHKLSLFAGLIGSLICLIASPLLSQFAFGNRDYTLSFAAVAISLLFLSLLSEKIVLMQTTRNLNYLVKSSMTGAILNLGVAVLIFYFLGLNGIIPAIISGYLVMYLVHAFYTKKINIEKGGPSPTFKQVIEEGKPMLKLGSTLMVGTVIIMSFTFLLNALISRLGNIKDVGYYQAASSICLQAIAVINTSLASDYYPRLSSKSNDYEHVKTTVNQQTELILIIIFPISIFLIIFAPFIVTVLLSNEFQQIVPMLRWMAFALIFRGIWYVIGYIALSKGDKTVYLIYDAIVGQGLTFALNILAYYFWGLQGLGFSFLLGAVIMVVVLSFVVKVKYNFHFELRIIKLFFLFILISTISLLSVFLLTGMYYYISGALLSMITITLTYYKLEKLIHIKKFIKNKLKCQNSL